MLVLETPRLLLRPWDDTCLDDFVQLAGNPAVMRYIGTGEIWEPERARQRHCRILEHWQDHGYGWRAAIDRTDGVMIGLEALNRLGRRVPGLDESLVEIGWWFTPRVWGRGLALEGAFAVRDEAFDRVRTAGVVGRYQPDNTASGRIMERLGMRHHSSHIDSGRTVRVTTLTRTEWHHVREGEHHARQP